jgi:dynactin-4
LIALNYIPYVTVKPLPVPGGLPPPGPDGNDTILQPGKTVQFVMTLRNPLFDDVSVSLGSPSVAPGKHGHRVTILCPQFQVGKNSDAWDDALNNPPNRGLVNAAGGEQIAGKLYDQGRNWASVVLEIVPASIVAKQDGELDEDEDVIEIPIRVRLEWTVTDEDAGTERRKKEKLLDEGEDADDGRRELSYWMVLGIGRVQC